MRIRKSDEDPEIGLLPENPKWQVHWCYDRAWRPLRGPRPQSLRGQGRGQGLATPHPSGPPGQGLEETLLFSSIRESEMIDSSLEASLLQG